MAVPIDTVIIEQVNKVLGHPEFIKWASGQQYKPNGLILINNSFVFRDVKTNKSDSYIALRLDDKLNYVLPPVIATSSKIIVDFKYLSPSSTLPPTRSIANAIEEEKKVIGELIFVLIGEIKDDLIEIEEIGHSEFKEICWDPKLKDAINIQPNLVEVGQVHDEDVVWEALVKYFTDSGQPVPDGLRSAVGIALDKLQQKAAAHLLIPKKGQPISTSITEQIITVLEEQLHDYDQALSRLASSPDDANARNEILRLAYNFANDAMGYLRFIVSVCDLKPLVLWGTLFHHYNLSEVFKLLPWTRSRNKASLKNYVDTISDARNSAFHNIFPFRKSLKVPLTGASLADAELLIFSEHAKKSENTLSFRDKALVEVLTEFTRARERHATDRFWKQNLDVMKETVELFKATADFIKDLHNNR